MSAIDEFLDQVFNHLGKTGSAGRRLLAEAEDHLNEAVAEGVADGLSVEDAKRRAIRSFGLPRTVARRLRRTTPAFIRRRRITITVGAVVVLLVAAVVGRAEYFVHVQGPRQITRFLATRSGTPVTVNLAASESPTLAQSLLLEYDCSAGETISQSMNPTSLSCEKRYQSLTFPAHAYQMLNRCLQRHGAHGQISPAIVPDQLPTGQHQSFVVQTDITGSSLVRTPPPATFNFVLLRGLTPAMLPALNRCETNK
jgi:hypothetical protein